MLNNFTIKVILRVEVTVVFDKDRFADFLKKAIGDRTTTDYADLTGVNRTYISKLLNKKLLSPPSPGIIKGLASNAYHNISYEDLMITAGYLPNTYTKVVEYPDHDDIYEYDEDGQVISVSTSIKDIDKLVERYERKKLSIEKSTEIPPPEHQKQLTITSHRIELADILDSNDVEITEGGEPISREKRKKLFDVIKNTDSVSIKPKVPILGTIRAGLPILAEEHWQEEIEVPNTLKADFALRVTGDSMLYVGIQPGYIAVFRRSEMAQNGQIVAAGIENMVWEANLKFYIQKNGHAVLRSANPDYEDIEFGPNHRIIGVMVGLFRDDTPSLMDYQNMLQIKEYQDKRWIEVIEKAVQLGIEPEHIKQIIEMQAIMAQKLTP